MKFIFFGTPRFATIIIGRLIEQGVLPTAVVTNPDRPTGRKQIITPPPVKKIVQKLNPKIPILQPNKIDDEFLSVLREYNIDCFIVAAYGKILPKELITIPPFGTIGVHPSILPKLRGATPIQSAILEGLKETGVSLFIIDEKMDHGPVIHTKTITISDSDNAETLSDKLAIISSEILIETINNLSNIKAAPQNESEATYVFKFSVDDAYIAPEIIEDAKEGKNNTAEIVYRKIRALNPEPGVWTMQNNKRVKILDAIIKDNKLVLKSIHIEGKKPIII